VQLDWSESMLPLAHRRILVTRSRQQASELAAALERLGGEAILVPTIAIAAPASFAGLDEALATVGGFDWVVFTSGNAVTAFCDRARELGLTLAARHVAVIGSATAKVATGCGLRVDLVPGEAVAEALAEALAVRVEPGSRVLLVRAAVARDVIPEALSAVAEVTVVEAYRTVVPVESLEVVARLFSEPSRYPDAITFTSSSTALNLFGLLAAAGLRLPETVVRASIGPVTSGTLAELGYPATVEAGVATVAGLAEVLGEYFGGLGTPLGGGIPWA
jgi:uroporphyrinogen-III synthase